MAHDFKSVREVFYKLVSISAILLFINCQYSPHPLFRTTIIDAHASSDSTHFYFFAVNRVFFLPTGMSRFPDGGRTKQAYRDISLWEFSLPDSSLTNIMHFDSLFLPHSQIVFNVYPGNKQVVFSIRPISSWKEKNSSVSEKNTLEKLYRGIWLYSAETHSLHRLTRFGAWPKLAPNESGVLFFEKASTGYTIWYTDVQNSHPRLIDSVKNVNPYHGSWVTPHQYNAVLDRHSLLAVNTRRRTVPIIKKEQSIKLPSTPKVIKSLVGHHSIEIFGVPVHRFLPSSTTDRYNQLMDFSLPLTYRREIAFALNKESPRAELDTLLLKLEQSFMQLPPLRQKIDRSEYVQLKNILQSH